MTTMTVATAAVAGAAVTTMTEPREPAAPASRPAIRKPGPFPVIAGSLGLFLAFVAVLAFQLRAGADPAIGAGKPEPVAAAASPAPRRVLIRRGIVTRIVGHRSRGGKAPTASAAPPTTSSAPSAPAPAPAAPAPAPAPAPMTTQSS